MAHSRFGYSAVNCFETCPYQYKLKWLEGLETVPTDDPANALVLGTAIHRAIETDVNTALREYFMSYPVINDLHINEAIKIQSMIPKVKAILPEGMHETEIESGLFKGTLDLLVPVKPEEMTLEEKDDICFKCPGGSVNCDYCNSGHCPKGKYEGFYDLYDFKYSNNVDRYMESKQLHVYKFYYEKTHPGHTIRNMYFVFIPKVQIRQKKTEDLFQFRKRLVEELKNKEPSIEPVEYQPEKVIAHLEGCLDIATAREFLPNQTRLCDWCEYKKFCNNKEDYMLLPKNERKQKEMNLSPDLWIYAQSYVGKTTFVDSFDDVLFLNTDGNTDNVTSPVIRIRDEWEGRIKKSAWEVFLDVLKELEKKENDFKIVAIDLIEDLYEHCRLYVYNREGWQHESDGGYGKGYDMIKLEFLSNMKRLKNMGYQVIYISKELAGQVTLRGNSTITTYKPNINDKVANVLAGTVDLTCRAYADDRGRWIGFKVDEYTFGGGRFDFKDARCELSRKAFVEAIKAAQVGMSAPVKTEPVKPTEPVKVEEPEQIALDIPEPDEPVAAEPVAEEPKRRTRRVRN